MYIVHIMNLKINIRILNFLFKSENCYFNCFIWISNFWFEYDISNFNSKRFIWFKKWYLNSKLIFQIQKLLFQFRKLLIDYKNGHFNFEYFYVNMKIYISTLKIFHLNFKYHLIWTSNFNSKLLFWIFKINNSILKIIK
jgi:hypothetical protein